MRFNIASGPNHPFCPALKADELELDRIQGLLEVEAAPQLPHLASDLLTAS